ncbi:conserved hypothetical protein [Paecilomyces variotii No. 5]|uniref:Phosphotransferase enzyme family protein n=1 Tax=Byssochlamys spectabilis (strain No. 5 / NBRC 109023) TaxID=1356009 RepID=V5HRK2_BYSSN|nr:conserved hypothetical protein [Paecilomyces variotii No. 5]
MAGGTNPDARKKVNKALASAGSAAVGAMVDAARSARKKRRELKEERDKGRAENEAKAKEKAKKKGQLWVDKINETHATGRLCPWVSTFHPKKLPCQLEGTFYHGSFNAGVKMVFSDGTAWMVRFARVGMVSDDYADEKVAMEVTTLRLLRDKTTIPVPKVQAWGSAASNSLGLGPFIIMDFIDGVSLDDIFHHPIAENRSRLVKEDVSDSDIEVIYRQIANFLLQIFQLDFDQIGSLPSPEDGPQGSTPARPLTFKAHTILQDGGVDTFGDRTKGFETATDYFQYVTSQDWEQLVHQPNSIDGPYNAKNKYVAFQALKSLAVDLVNAQYDRHKFKLICDDFGLGNFIVRSREDLTVVGVVDLEWSYIGPAQLLATAPWWLLGDRPGNEEWDCDADDEPPCEVATRYFRYLDIFIRVLEEEEAILPGHEAKGFSSLVKWSQSSGAMWLHMLLTTSFHDIHTFPFTHLLRHLGASEWEKRKNQFENEEELEEFAARKMDELNEYDNVLEKLEKDKELVDSGEMTKEEFLARATTGSYSLNVVSRGPITGE